MPNNMENDLKELASKYDNLDVKSASFDEQEGTLTMNVGITGGPLPASLPNGVQVVASDNGVADLLGNVSQDKESASLRTIYTDSLSRGDLDLLEGFSVLDATPQQLYQKAIDYYRCKDVFGTTVNVLSNFASKGFENDIDDPTIKNFFDSWVADTNFEATVDSIFFDFFRVGLVRTYKILGKYEPSISHISSLPGKKPAKVKKATAAKKNRFSNTFIPIAYTILNPTQVEIKGSLMFGQTVTFLKASAGKDIKELLEIPKKGLSTFERKLLENMPSDWKKAAMDGKPIPLDQDLIGAVDYRRMPYEKYPIPRGARAFESVQFKDELRKADYSTLDGITNYILKITVGNDNFPVHKQETLERVGEMFDTVSKSFKVVWNHTLDVEKITSPEVGEILGQDKYKQVNEDITGALGIPRALLDGGGELNPASADLALKTVIEEINYARKQVTRWIYSEYKQVAKAMGFDRIPKVRFDDMALRDELQMMSIVQGLIDRRIISYRTGQSKLGFDSDSEISQMTEELPLVQEGTLGIVGSPFQQSARQDTQGTPKGTPSEGRPSGRPAPTPKKKDETKPPVPKKAKDNASFDDWVKELSLKELENLIKFKKESEE